MNNRRRLRLRDSCASRLRRWWLLQLLLLPHSIWANARSRKLSPSVANGILAIGCHGTPYVERHSTATCVQNLREFSTRLSEHIINFVRRMESMIFDNTLNSNRNRLAKMREYSFRRACAKYRRIRWEKNTEECLSLSITSSSLSLSIPHRLLLLRKPKSWLIAFTLRFQCPVEWNDSDEVCNSSSGLAHKQLADWWL